MTSSLVGSVMCIRDRGLEAVNPVNGKKIPIFIADYVMMGYGTGAIMAVPAHDQRDYDFAKKFGIDIIQVIKGGDIEKERPPPSVKAETPCITAGGLVCARGRTFSPPPSPPTPETEGSPEAGHR